MSTGQEDDSVEALNERARQICAFVDVQSVARTEIREEGFR